MKVSVALAYYNGGRFIAEQISSILTQLSLSDELIISIDEASDGSDAVLRRLAQEDSRICLIEGPKKGVVKNFENAISHCSGDIIFLSDQDDIWKDGKVAKVKKAFQKSGCPAIIHNGEIVDENGEKTGGKTLYDLRGSGGGIAKNLIRNSYVGCCMAFKKELLPVILPIPDAMYMHDFWIGAAAEYCGGTGWLKEPLIYYRRHGKNTTNLHHGRLSFMVNKRMDIVRCLALLRERIKKEGAGKTWN